MNTLIILNLLQQKLSLRDVDGLITNTYMLAVVTALVTLGIAILISNSIAYELSEKPKDPRKRKIIFWVTAIVTPILFYVYNLFLVIPNIKKGPALDKFFMTSAISPVVSLVTFILVGFILSKIFKSKKIGTWF
jgi:uncharacterized membrane protein